MQFAIVDKYLDSCYFGKGGDTMAYTEAQKRAVIKYLEEKTDDIRLRTAKGTKDRYRAEAEKHGLSMTKYILEAVETYIESGSKPIAESDIKSMLTDTEYAEFMRILEKKGQNLKDFLRKAITAYIDKHKED